MFKKKITLACFLVTILLHSLALGQNQKPVVEVSASLNKETILVGEPLFLELELKNNSKDTVDFKTRLSFYADLKIMIFIPENLPIEYHGTNEPNIYPYFVFKIPSLETERVSFPIFYNKDAPDGLLFGKPNKVAIKISQEAMIGNQKQIYRFDTFHVNVVAPPEKHAKALGFLRKKELIKDIHQFRASPENLDAFEKFIQTFPHSPYKLNIIFTLAGGYVAKAKDSPENYNMAINLYKKLIKDYPDSIITDDAVYKIGDCYNSLGDKKNARKWFVKLFNQYPESNRINHYDPIIKEHLFNRESPYVYSYLWMLYDSAGDVPEKE